MAPKLTQPILNEIQYQSSRAYISTSSRFLNPNINPNLFISVIFPKPQKRNEMNYDMIDIVIILNLANLSRSIFLTYIPKPQTKIEQSRHLEMIYIIILLSSFLNIPKPQKERSAAAGLTYVKGPLFTTAAAPKLL